MSVMNETRRVGDFVLSEANGHLSRDAITVSGTNVPGTVLGKITATGKHVALAPGASDGSQTAAGVLYGFSTGTDDSGVAIKRAAEVRADMLVWPAGISDANKTAALSALAGSLVVAR